MMRPSRFAVALATALQGFNIGGVTPEVQNLATNGVLNAKSLGCKGDGVTDDTASLQAAFNQAALTGKKLHVPSGVYLMSSRVQVLLTDANKDICVECDPSVIFKSTASFPNNVQMFNFQVTAGTKMHNFSWTGGMIDGRLRPALVAGSAPDLMSIAGSTAGQNVFEKMQKAYIAGVHFLNNDTRAGSSGDSCLFLAGLNDVSVTNCIFQGAVDAGIYLSGIGVTGGTDYYGRRCYIYGNTFIECREVGFISKRDYKEQIIAHNFVFNCKTGIVVGGGVTGGGASSAKTGLIIGNILKNVERGIGATQSDGAVISGNRIEDYGLKSDGTSVGESGISIQGSSHCVITGNHLTFSGSFTPNASAKAINLATSNINNALAEAAPTLYTMIANNNIKGGAFGVFEAVGSPGVDFTYASDNIITGLSNSRFRMLGTNSEYGQRFAVAGPSATVTIRDTSSSIATAKPSLRLGESESTGVLDNYGHVTFDGSRTALTFGFGNAPAATEGVAMSIHQTRLTLKLNPLATPLLNAAGSAGEMYYDNTSSRLRVHNGTAWGNVVPIIGNTLEVNQTDPAFVLRDTVTTQSTANSTLRIGHSNAGGTLENYGYMQYSGSKGGVAIGFKDAATGASEFDVVQVNYLRKTVKFMPLDTAPASATAGEVYYDSSTNTLRCFNGTIWNDLF